MMIGKTMTIEPVVSNLDARKSMAINPTNLGSLNSATTNITDTNNTANTTITPTTTNVEVEIKVDQVVHPKPNYLKTIADQWIGKGAFGT